MLRTGHSKITSILGALTLLVMLAGQILPYSETCFGIEITEVVDFDETENDSDPDEKKEKLKAHELMLRSDFKSILIADFLFQQGLHPAPALEILIPPPKQA